MVDQTRPEPAGETPPDYHVSAESSLAERRRYTLKHGDTFAILDPYGDADGISHEGLYHRDTRFLSQSRLSLNGKRPLLLSSDVDQENVAFRADLTNPDLFDGERLSVCKDTVHLSRTIFLWNSCRYDMLCLKHFGTQLARLTLWIDVQADFADLFEVRGFHRQRRGAVAAATETDATLRFVYQSMDGQPRSTDITFAPAPAKLTRGRAVFNIDLAPAASQTILMTSSCTTQWSDRDAEGFRTALRAARRAARRPARRPGTSRWPRIESSDGGVNALMARCAADLSMLCTDTPYGCYPYAGIPWFSTPFGRDGIITGLETLWLEPAISRGVLRFLAAFQAKTLNADTDAEPGKILHEMRRGELAELGEIPFARYYGSVDATPLFVALAGKYWKRTADQETLNELWPSIEAALRWIDQYGDHDGDGFVDYGGGAGRGLVNQGWKDSHDSVFHSDGGLASPPVALCEVQGYVYLARIEAAAMARALGHQAFSDKLLRQAASLAQAFENAFWCDEIGAYGLALDGRGQLCRVRTSNGAQVLLSGMASPDRAARLAGQLAGPDFFSGWGLRTVAVGEPRFNPCSYHNGSIWPHDNALAAMGLARYGFHALVDRVTAALFDAAHRMPLRRLPELFCGFRRRPNRGPTLYPVACAPQSWAAAAPFALIEACLRPEFDSSASRLRLHDPQLPASLEWMRICGLSVGASRIDLLLRRTGPSVRAEVTAGEARVEVV